MIIVLVLLLTVLAALIVVSVAGQKYNNKFEIEMVFGVPGSGKSTYTTIRMAQHLKKGWSVYTDDSSVKLKGVKKYNDQELKNGHFDPRQFESDPNSSILLVLDEVGLTYPSRQFKTNFIPETLEWWRKHRHKKIKIIMASQGAEDADKVLRDMTTNYFVIRRSKWFCPQFIMVRSIKKKIDISNTVSSDGENLHAGGAITDVYKYGGFKIYYLPKWVKKFDSYR